VDQVVPSLLHALAGFTGRVKGARPCLTRAGLHDAMGLKRFSTRLRHYSLMNENG
jgi:hypothetical protein